MCNGPHEAYGIPLTCPSGPIILMGCGWPVMASLWCTIECWAFSPFTLVQSLTKTWSLIVHPRALLWLLDIDHFLLSSAVIQKREKKKGSPRALAAGGRLSWKKHSCHLIWNTSTGENKLPFQTKLRVKWYTDGWELARCIWLIEDPRCLKYPDTSYLCGYYMILMRVLFQASSYTYTCKICFDWSPHFINFNISKENWCQTDSRL